MVVVVHGGFLFLIFFKKNFRWVGGERGRGVSDEDGEVYNGGEKVEREKVTNPFLWVSNQIFYKILLKL